MRSLRSEPGASCAFHSHPFEEFTLVTDDSTTNGFARGKVRSAPNTLYFFHRGEPHGHWNEPRESPRFWVIHFDAGLETGRHFAGLSARDPAKRIWHLTPEQVTTFKWIFLKLCDGNGRQGHAAEFAGTAWLSVLLVEMEAWFRGCGTASFGPQAFDPEVVRLWQLVNDCVGRTADFTRRITGWSNYDSLRHRFKDAFGASPVQLLGQLRVQRAQHLLLETSLSVKEIALSLGYERQHEFARAFRKRVGRSPTDWRRNPFPSTLSFGDGLAVNPGMTHRPMQVYAD